VVLKSTPPWLGRIHRAVLRAAAGQAARGGPQGRELTCAANPRWIRALPGKKRGNCPGTRFILVVNCSWRGANRAGRLREIMAGDRQISGPAWPLQGQKILNVEKAVTIRCLPRKKFAAILTALGTGIGKGRFRWAGKLRYPQSDSDDRRRRGRAATSVRCCLTFSPPHERTMIEGGAAMSTSRRPAAVFASEGAGQDAER